MWSPGIGWWCDAGGLRIHPYWRNNEMPIKS
jgi:hypothetical protein